MATLIIETFREGYGIDQVKKTMTAAELISLLEDFDDDTRIYLSVDNGYTCGGITEGRIEEREEKDDE